MMLVEVGLPTGAQVDRLTLEQGLGWWGSTEVRPDRVVLYLWPRPGGTELSFTLTPRIAGEVVSAPFVSYDYYNPEARVVLPPRGFVFHD